MPLTNFRLTDMMMNRTDDFTCNLVEQSRLHLQFLSSLHKLGVTLQPLRTHSFHRYVDLWLPLVHQQACVSGHVGCSTVPTPLIPPPDVAWIWHCHRLAPLKYEAYVKKRFGALLEASPSFAFQSKPSDSNVCLENDRAVQTRQLWQDLYSHEPFFLVNSEESKSPSDDGTAACCGEALDGFNLSGSMQVQATFLWQVSSPAYLEEAFLKEGIDRYHKFLSLSRLAETSNKDVLPLVPTYQLISCKRECVARFTIILNQIDFLWHTHILASIQNYNEDCLRICGHKFYHDDSLNDRTPGALLDRALRQTERLWEHHYRESYKIIHWGESPNAGLYRGEPPSSFYDFATWNGAISEAESHGKQGGSSVASRIGATSTGRPAVGTTLSPSQHPYWRDINQEPLSSTGEPLYVTAKERRNKGPTTPDPNPVRPHYVFGRGSQGWGYYSFEAREAWQMVWNRLEAKALKEQRSLKTLERQALLCRLFPALHAKQVEKQAALQQSLSQIRQEQQAVLALLQSRGPGDWSSTAVLQEAVGAAGCGGAGIFTQHPPAFLYGQGGRDSGRRGFGGGCVGGGCGGGCGGS